MDLKSGFSECRRAIGIAAVSVSCCIGSAFAEVESDPAKYVDVFVGTDGTGHTYPGVVAPHGMVQPSPETGYEKWKYCSGYNFSDGRILSFGQTHLSGTGCPDSGDAAFIPFTGDAVKKDYSSAFQKKNERAEVGYYSVLLDDAQAEVEIAASERVALYRIKYLADGGGVFFDFQTGMVGHIAARVESCDVKKIDDFTIAGSMKVRSFTRRDISFAVKFDRPIKRISEIEKPKNHKAPRWAVEFGLKSGETLKIKAAVSTVDIAGALENLASLGGWDFDAVRAQTRTAWNKILSKISVDGGENRKKLFYTSLYHAFVSPNNISDVDGRYRGAGGKVASATSSSKKYYTNLSLWDTYRSVFALTSLVEPSLTADVVNSMLDHYDAFGILPTNGYWGKETFCMIGNHAVSAISAAICRGDTGFDYDRALDAMIVSSTKNHKKSDFSMLEKYGYYPFDLFNPESVSKTLENCIGDSALARAAEKMGRAAVAAKFSKRAQLWKNLFDPSVKFMRAKDSKGKWREPFDPFEFSHGESFGGDYTEGNAWQYSFHVQQDVDGLIEAYGGRAEFTAAIDRLFSAKYPSGKKYKKSDDISGLIGQYVHGNEPSHHIVYMYTLAGAHDKAVDRIREICGTLYKLMPDGVCGNDDCGQMGSWYVLSTLGFYPLDPNDLRYVFGAPQFERASIDLGNGKKFEIFARGLSDENRYVKSVKLNGKELSRPWISHAEITAGGTLEFFMRGR